MNEAIRRLTFVTDAPYLGGAEQYVNLMAQAAAARGLRPHVLWMRPVQGAPDVFDATRAAGIEVTVAGRTGGFRAKKRAIDRLMHVDRPDVLIVNASGRRGFWQVPWLIRWYGLACLWVHHMVDGRDPRRLRPGRLGGRVEGPGLWRVPQVVRHRLAASGATGVVTLNEADRQHVIGVHRVPARKVHVIPNGIDTQRFRFDADARARSRASWGLPADACFVVGTAGRLVAGKGVERVIEAVALLAARGLPAVLVVAGTGPDEVRFRAFARRLGVSDSVRFLGFIPDMAAFYSGLDVFALASATESFGLVLAEAMACGRPVVATPTAGAVSQIRHGSDGWLLADFSSNALADAFENSFRAPAEAAALGRAARAAVARRFSVDRALDQTLALLAPRFRAADERWPTASPPIVWRPLWEDSR